MTTLVEQKIDYQKLFKLRLVVARFGEMDINRWWNTKGILGKYGSLAIKRGFPRTNEFAQARIAFSVARNRCKEIFDPPGCMTLWHLPALIEEQFETQWHVWQSQLENWSPFFGELELPGEKDLIQFLLNLNLVTTPQVKTVKQLRRSAEGRAVPITGVHEISNDIMVVLAAGFSRGEPDNPSVPYARLED